MNRGSQPDADGGLALAEQLGAAGDAAGVVQQVEQLQQVGFGQGLTLGHGFHGCIVKRNVRINPIALIE
jgi:hypothetical protein